MKSHLIKSLLFISLPITLLSACDNSPKENTIDPTFNNIQEGLMKLRSINNFTLNYRINGEEFIKEYSDTAYYSSYDNLGYIKNTSNQVYPFSLEENEIISGEVLQNVTNIYGNELVTTFSDFTFQNLDTSSKIININSNNDRRAFLELVGEDVNKIFDVTSFRLIYGENDLNSFVFDMTLTDGEDESTIIAELNNVGTTSLSNVDEYLNNGGTYYTPSDDFIRIRELFSNSNYTHNIYGYDENNNEIKIGEEIFTPNYYVTVYDYNVYPEGNAYNNAFYKADNETLTLIDDKSGQSATITQNGIYMGFLLYDTSISDYIFSPLYTRPINDETTDIITAARYPTNLLTFSNFQKYYFDEEYQVYFTTNFDLSYDLYDKFYVSDYFEETDVITLLGNSFSYNLAASDELCEVTFSLYLTVNNQYTYELSFEFTNFNNSSFKLLEDFVTTWVYHV